MRSRRSTRKAHQIWRTRRHARRRLLRQSRRSGSCLCVRSDRCDRTKQTDSSDRSTGSREAGQTGNHPGRSLHRRRIHSSGLARHHGHPARSPSRSRVPGRPIAGQTGETDRQSARFAWLRALVGNPILGLDRQQRRTTQQCPTGKGCRDSIVARMASHSPGSERALRPNHRRHCHREQPSTKARVTWSTARR